jgi:hypothetical protein
MYNKLWNIGKSVGGRTIFKANFYLTLQKLKSIFKRVWKIKILKRIYLFSQNPNLLFMHYFLFLQNF